MRHPGESEGVRADVEILAVITLYGDNLSGHDTRTASPSTVGTGIGKGLSSTQESASGTSEPVSLPISQWPWGHAPPKSLA